MLSPTDIALAWLRVQKQHDLHYDFLGGSDKPCIELNDSPIALSTFKTSFPLPHSPASNWIGVWDRAPHIAQCNSPPIQSRKENFHGTIGTLGVQHLPSIVELFPSARKADRVADRYSMQFRKHQTLLFHSAQSSGDPAIRNESNRFGVPFNSARIDQCLQGRGIPVVVFRGYDNEGICICQPLLQ